MTTEAQSILRKSLDDVSRLQKRQFATGIVVLFSLMLCVFWAWSHQRKSSGKYTKLSRCGHVLRAGLNVLRGDGIRIASTPHDQEDTPSD